MLEIDVVCWHVIVQYLGIWLKEENHNLISTLIMVNLKLGVHEVYFLSVKLKQM